VLQHCLCAVSTQIIEMRVPSLPVSPGASKLLLLLVVVVIVLLLLLLPACYSLKYSSNKPHVKMILITVRVIQLEKFVTYGTRLWLLIHGHTSSNLWSLECRQRLVRLTNFFCVFGNAGECSCVTGLYQVSDVRVWKLQCWSLLGMNTAYNLEIIVVYRLEILY
jgi:hypothetical protein